MYIHEAFLKRVKNHHAKIFLLVFLEKRYRLSIRKDRPAHVNFQIFLTEKYAGRYRRKIMTQHEAMEALSLQTGIRLEFNDNGLCRLRFDGRFIVDMEVTDDETAIYLYCRLGRLPAAERGRELMQRMMHAHCLGRESGRTIFGLDDDDVLAFSRVELTGAGENTLYTALEEFLDVVAAWTDEIQK